LAQVCDLRISLKKQKIHCLVRRSSAIWQTKPRLLNRPNRVVVDAASQGKF
jgi:hypothetical protein